jgi:hypothetical protein
MIIHYLKESSSPSSNWYLGSELSPPLLSLPSDYPSLEVLHHIIDRNGAPVCISEIANEEINFGESGISITDENGNDKVVMKELTIEQYTEFKRLIDIANETMTSSIESNNGLDSRVQLEERSREEYVASLNYVLDIFEA